MRRGKLIKAPQIAASMARAAATKGLIQLKPLFLTKDVPQRTI